MWVCWWRSCRDPIRPRKRPNRLPSAHSVYRRRHAWRLVEEVRGHRVWDALRSLAKMDAALWAGQAHDSSIVLRRLLTHVGNTLSPLQIELNWGSTSGLSWRRTLYVVRTSAQNPIGESPELQLETRPASKHREAPRNSPREDHRQTNPRSRSH